MTHMQNSSCWAEVVYSRFGKFESLCARLTVVVPEGLLSFRTIFEIIPEPRCCSSRMYRYHGHRARVLIHDDAVFAAGPLDMTMASPYCRIMDRIYTGKAPSTAGVVKSDTKAVKSFAPPYHNIIIRLLHAIFRDRSINSVNLQQCCVL